MGRRKTSGWLVVRAAARSVAAARRRAAEAQQARCRELLERPEDFRYDSIKVERLARQNSEVLLPAWKAILRSPQQPFERRLTVAKFLCGLKDDAGLDFLLNVLRDGTAPERGEALSEINSLTHFERPWLQRRADELHPLLLAQFDERLGAEQPNLIPQAAWACKCLKPPGAPEAARRLWHKELSPQARCSVAELLPKGAKTLDALRPLEAALQRPGLREFDHGELLHGVAHFLDSPAPGVAQEASRMLRQYFPWERENLTREGAGASSWWYPIIEEVARRAGREGVPLLEAFLRSRLNASYRNIALRELASVLGPEALPLIEERLQGTKPAYGAISALGVAFKGTGDAAQVARLRELAARWPEDEEVAQSVAEALAAIGGPRAQDASCSGLPAGQLRPGQRAEMRAFTRGTTPQQAWCRLAELGLVPPPTEDGLRLLLEREEETHDWSRAVMGQAGLTVAFDAETGEVPCRHDLLIGYFAEGSGGLFLPEAVLQQEQEDDDDCDVQFIFRDRLYRFVARNCGDYYDTERTAAAINRALEDASLAQRFVDLDTGDQTACYLFGDPARIRQAAEEFGWALAACSEEE